MAVLAASALSGNALAGPIPQGDIGLQTLGGEVGPKLLVGTINAKRLANPMNVLGNEGGEPDDKTPDFALDDPPPDTGNPDQTPIVTDPAPQTAQVPEPGMLGIFGAGLVALGLLRRRRG